MCQQHANSKMRQKAILMDLFSKKQIPSEATFISSYFCEQECGILSYTLLLDFDLAYC